MPRRQQLFIWVQDKSPLPTTPSEKDHLGDERGRWTTSLLIFSDERAKMPVTYTTYTFPSETLNRVFTCAARLPLRNNDLWDRGDPERWQWHHRYPYVSHARSSKILHRLFWEVMWREFWSLFHVLIHQGKGLEQFFKSCMFFLILLGRKSNKSPSFCLTFCHFQSALVHDMSLLI